MHFLKLVQRPSVNQLAALAAQTAPSGLQVPLGVLALLPPAENLDNFPRGA